MSAVYSPLSLFHICLHSHQYRNLSVAVGCS
uniref:Uncharacterized protein n=1 Tax=Rhizophora mucronata TaxID=61149 RepID=A0A2P2QPC1_RHIMU